MDRDLKICEATKRQRIVYYIALGLVAVCMVCAWVGLIGYQSLEVFFGFGTMGLIFIVIGYIEKVSVMREYIKKIKSKETE